MSENFAKSKKWYQMKEQAAGEKRLLFTWYIYKFLGKNTVKFIAFWVTLCAFCSAKVVRNSSKNNLSVIQNFGGEKGLNSPEPSLLNCFKNVLNYSLSLVDNMEIFAGDFDLNKIFFENEEDKKIFYADIALRKGIFFICSHTGNINVLRMFFKNDDPQERSDVNILLSKEQCKVFNSFLKKVYETGKKKMKNKVSLFPVEEISIETSIELKEKIEKGEIAFMAGDRLSCGTSNLTFSADFFNEKVQFPVGTFKLAQLMECPVYFICALKDRHDSYKVYLEKFLFNGSKKETLSEMQRRYVDFVQRITLIDPLQFYHFYKFFC